MSRKSVTRYAILFKLLLISVMTLSLSACFSWGARAFDNFPETTALDKHYQYDGKVLIIGAGASGLAAASILERNKIDYQIIEASNRYGGRLKKNEGFADFPIDLGAEWIHNHPAILNRLKGDRSDLPKEQLVPYRLNHSFEWDGETYEEIPKWQMDAYYDSFPESKFKRSTWFDYVDENFASKVKHRIIFNAPVVKIDYEGDQVKVTTQNGKIYTADKVIVTVSLGVLQSNMIMFSPALSTEKMKAIHSLDFAPGFKLMMKFKEKFYPDMIDSDTDWGEKVFFDVAFSKEAKTHVLGLLSTGASAQYYNSLGGEKAIVDDALNELDRIFAGKASQLFTGEYLFENWGKHEYTRGTWAETHEIDDATMEILGKPLNDSVFFAGEIHDIHQQLGVPSAILSGFDAVDLALKKYEQ